MVSYVGMDGSFSEGRSAAFEIRGAALLERRESFFEVGRAARQLQVVKFLAHRLGQRPLLGVVDGLFGQPERHRGTGGQSDEEVLGRGVDIGGGDRAMDEALRSQE